MQKWEVGKKNENTGNGACRKSVVALGSESATPRDGMTEGRVHREENWDTSD
jgi:hypothetical protein